MLRQQKARIAQQVIEGATAISPAEIVSGIVTQRQEVKVAKVLGRSKLPRSRLNHSSYPPPGRRGGGEEHRK